VTVYQSKEEVEAALVDHLQTYMLSEKALTMVIGQVRAEIEAQLPDGERQIWKISGDADFAAVTESSLVSFGERPQRDSNPCYLRERRVS
jgi:hypothetical protein